MENEKKKLMDITICNDNLRTVTGVQRATKLK
jgi:hypothetical protein